MELYLIFKTTRFAGKRSYNPMEVFFDNSLTDHHKRSAIYLLTIAETAMPPISIRRFIDNVNMTYYL